ncbi:MAG TPA: hypothetical protein VHY31_01125 [Streptosporangiaceae bacterium]|jgi:hypothetical protein|nr:hypothetical protein [Streptosporangiaceae bacterium]
MRIPPEVSERVKEAPAQALRAVFSGIGQVLLVADRIKSRATEPPRSPAPPRPRPRPQSPAAGPAAPAKDQTRWRSLDETGNVRLLSEEDKTKDKTKAEPAAAPPAATAEAEPATAGEPETAVEPPAALAETPAPPESSAPEPAAAPPAATAAALPVPNYDELTVASLRARLRNLDAAQLRVMADYEKANAGREAVVTMFERRIAKLESGEA